MTVHEILVLIVSASNEGASEPAHIIEHRHMISNNVVFVQVYTQTSMCRLLVSLETPNDEYSSG